MTFTKLNTDVIVTHFRSYETDAENSVSKLNKLNTNKSITFGYIPVQPTPESAPSYYSLVCTYDSNSSYTVDELRYICLMALVDSVC